MDEHKRQIVELTQGITFGKKSMSIIEVTKSAVEPDAMPGSSTNTREYALWGADNDRPQAVIDENMQDGTSAGALRFKIWAHYGAGVYFFRKRVEKGKEIIEPMLLEELPPEMEDWMWANDLPNLAQAVISDYEWWSFYYMQYLFARGGKIYEVKWQRVKDVRVGLRDPKTGKVPHYVLSGRWPMPKPDEKAKVPAMDRLNPARTPNGMMRHSLPSIDKDYYPTAYWQSNLAWLAVAKKIPQWINANMDNSINVKYHIKIPEKYFIDLYPEDRYKSMDECMKARKDAEAELKLNIDNMLAGARNASKTFYTKIAMNEDTGQPYPGWEITPIPNDLKDTAWLNAYGTAAAALGTAHGVPPSLQGLILATGLGTGSASDVREQFNYYLQLNTVIPRQTTTEWYEIVKRVNGWPRDIHMGYRNIVLQSMNENKSGYIVQNEPNPTTQRKDEEETA
jgi:hypothetical protein